MLACVVCGRNDDGGGKRMSFIRGGEISVCFNLEFNGNLKVEPTFVRVMHETKNKVG